MGLEDLVDDDVDTSSDSTDPENGGSKDDGRAKGEDDYFNTSVKSSQSPIDRYKDAITIDGEDRGAYTLYVTISSTLRVKGGKILNDKAETVVDVSDKDFSINVKEMKVTYGDRMDRKMVYEIKVR